jgi:hypothetical protein
LNQEQKGLELEDNLEKSFILFSELVDGWVRPSEKTRFSDSWAQIWNSSVRPKYTWDSRQRIYF